MPHKGYTSRLKAYLQQSGHGKNTILYISVTHTPRCNVLLLSVMEHTVFSDDTVLHSYRSPFAAITSETQNKTHQSRAYICSDESALPFAWQNMSFPLSIKICLSLLPGVMYISLCLAQCAFPSQNLYIPLPFGHFFLPSSVESLFTNQNVSFPFAWQNIPTYLSRSYFEL